MEYPTTSSLTPNMYMVEEIAMERFTSLTDKYYSLRNRLSSVRSMIMFPFNLWLWAVSIPIRFFLYLTFGEFWKWTEQTKSRQGNVSVAPKTVSAKKDELLRGEASVMNTPPRMTLDVNWTNDFTTKSVPQQPLAQGSLTKADQDVMLAKKIAVTGSTSSSRPAALKLRSRPVAARSVDKQEEAIGSFITVDKQVAKKSKKQAKQSEQSERISSFVTVSKTEEKQFKTVERRPSFVSLDTEFVVEEEELTTKPAFERSASFVTLETEAEPAEAQSVERTASFVSLETESAPVKAEKPEHRNAADDLLELNQRQNFELQQQNSELKIQLREEHMAKSKFQNEYETVQSRLLDAENKLNQVADKKKTKRALKLKQAKAVPVEHAWEKPLVETHELSFTDKVAEAQRELQASLEVSSPAVEKSKQAEFLVVGGPESNMHVSSISAN